MDDDDWVVDAHDRVDRVISSFGRIDKLKTIGDIVMLAGPFVDDRSSQRCDEITSQQLHHHPSVVTDHAAAAPSHNDHNVVSRVSEDDLQAAADELLACCALARRVTPIKAGLHVGEVVGAVLGTSRLAFDIFGDTVNVASRVMSTCPLIGSVAVSGEFHHAWLRDATSPRASGMALPVEFGPPSSPYFKGKGDVDVFEVVTLNAIDAMEVTRHGGTYRHACEADLEVHELEDALQPPSENPLSQKHITLAE